MTVLRAEARSSPVPAGDGQGDPNEVRPGFLDTLRAILHSVRLLLDTLRPTGRSRVLLALVTVGAALVVGILVFSGVSLWYTSRPQFCNLCHAMSPYYNAWEASPHRTVNCEDCHAPPGPLGFIGAKVGALQEVLDYTQGNFTNESFNAAVSNANCLQCHSSVLKHDIVVNGLKANHSYMIKDGGKCIFCHSTVAHGNAVPVGSRTEPTMAACFKCHNGVTAATTCTMCHVQAGTIGKPSVKPNQPTEAPVP